MIRTNRQNNQLHRTRYALLGALSLLSLQAVASAGGFVTYDLSSPQQGTTVSAGAQIQWTITIISVSSGDNAGLALFSVDLEQNPTNPSLFDMPTGDSVPTGMEDFDRPLGVSNPGPCGLGSAYGGTPVLDPLLGVKNLRQIGGAQNNFGVSGGPIGQDFTARANVGHGGNLVVAQGSFPAPCTPGPYSFSIPIETVFANTFDAVNTPPAISPVGSATVLISTGSFNFTVDEGADCLGACCEGGLICQSRTSSDCATAGGTYLADSSTCEDCWLVGACCAVDGTCSVLGEEDCTGCPPGELCPQHTGGLYQGNGTVCEAGLCGGPQPTGACCLAEDTCTDGQTSAQCPGLGGLYRGDSTTCATDSCSGACCFDGACLGEASGADCIAPGADFQDFDTTCAGVDCVTRGACCVLDGTCVEATPVGCAFRGGVYAGDSTECDEGQCPSMGACCDPVEETCTDGTEEVCVFGGGVFQGAGTTCPTTCPTVRFRNVIDPLANAEPCGPGLALADDISLSGTGTCTLGSYDLAVTGNGGGKFVVTAGMYTDCPGADEGPCTGGTLIPGTEITWDDLPDNGSPLFLDAQLDLPVTIPEQIWVVVEFSTAQAAWFLADQPTIGSTADVFGKNLPPWGCNGYFQGGPHAGFWVNLGCVDPQSACCTDDGNCTDVLTPEACTALGGRYRGSGTDCASVSCYGACCENDGTCSDGSLADCTTGIYQGDGTSCLAGACSGACCTSNEACVDGQWGSDCAAAGGVYQGHGSTCAEAGCVRGACCQGTGCSIVTPVECTDGVFHGAGSCCVDVGCPPTGACCTGPGDECSIMSEEACTGCPPGGLPCVHHTGNTYQGDDTSCSPNNPCTGLPPGTGACCLEDACCVEGKTDAQCTAAGGMYKGDDSVCSSQSCAQPQTGACCLSDSSCVEDLNEDQCVFANGVFLGTIYDCTPDPCGLTGACCMPNGDCVADQTLAQCGAIGGTYWGNATLCDPVNPCPEPTGACCVGIACQDTQTVVSCGILGGVYQGDFSACARTNCKVTGACCLPAADCATDCDGPCDVLTASACAYQGGGYAGDGTKCLGMDCSDCDDGPTVFGTCQTDERTQVVADDADGGAWFGYAVSLSGDMALVGAPADGEGSYGSAYVINLGNADCGVGQTKLRASDPAIGGSFGKSVAISGDTAVVIDPDADIEGQKGIPYIFQKPLPGGWGASMVETARLKISDPGNSKFVAETVAINENQSIIVVGYPQDCEGNCDCDPNAIESGCGSVYVYHRPPLGWGNNEEDFILTADDFGAGSGYDWFGGAVSISGNTAIVGAPFDDEPPLTQNNRGSAYIFRYDGADWPPEQKLIACDAADDDNFGASVSISGDVAVVGAPHDDGAGIWISGSAYIFRFDPQSGEWHQEAKLTASDGAIHDQFGLSVSISGDLVVIGARYDDETCTIPQNCNSGSAYVFRFDGLDWNERARFNASDISPSDQFGISVSISGAAALVGAQLGEAILGVNNSGAAYQFKGLSDCDETQSMDLCDFVNDPSIDCCPPSHNCCETGHGSGCSDLDIQNCVCETSGYGLCCADEWVETCVLAVEWLGCDSCSVGNGIIDTCESCPPDFDRDGDVDATDLAFLLGNWGPCSGASCPADLNFDCVVGAADLANLLGCWGDPCSCGEQAQWNGGPDGWGALRFALGGGNGCLSLEEAVQMLGHEDVDAFIAWVLSAVPPDMVYQVAQFLLWLLDHWPC